MTKPRTAAIYARLSVAAEESVSIDRQVEAAKRYAEARGWDVVLVAVDDGVSATKKRPETREGWQRILSAAEAFDAVIVWKIDRLARSVLDFLVAHKALEDRDAAIVAVEDPIDMTTAQGRAFSVILAVFAELEAAAISARVKASRAFLLASGRVAGGERPWPFDLAPNPDGPGYVLAPIPERAAAIREAAADLIEGRASVSEVARRWTEAGLRPKGKRRNGKAPRPSWSPSSVGALLRNPALYGATRLGDDVVRDADGSIRIGSHAIVDRVTWLRLQETLSGSPVRRSGAEPALLADLARCDACGSRLHAKRPSTRPESAHKYVCQNRDCPARVAVSLPRLDAFVEDRYLSHGGDLLRAREVIVNPGADPEALALVRADLDDIARRLDVADNDAEVLSLVRRRRERREELTRLEAAGDPVVRETRTPRTWAEDWQAADLAGRRALLAERYEAVRVRKGEPHAHGLDPARVSIVPRSTLTDVEAARRAVAAATPVDFEPSTPEG